MAVGADPVEVAVKLEIENQGFTEAFENWHWSLAIGGEWCPMTGFDLQAIPRRETKTLEGKVKIWPHIHKGEHPVWLTLYPTGFREPLKNSPSKASYMWSFGLSRTADGGNDLGMMLKAM